MKLTEVEYPDGAPIDGYGPGFFRVAGTVHQGPTLVLPKGVTQWGGLGDWARAAAEASDIDVLFIGMGAEIAALPADDRTVLDAAGIAYEIMPTAPAARTYNVLLGEGRRVGAALTPL